LWSRQFAEQVGGFVRRHLLQNIGGGFLRDGFQQLRLNAGIFDFGQCVGGGLWIQGAKHRGAFVRIQVDEDLGDVGGVQIVELALHHAEANAVCLLIQGDRLDVLPANQPLGAEIRCAWRHTAQEPIDDGLPPHASCQSAGADIDVHQSQVSLAELEKVQIVDPDDLGAVHVDDLLVQ
jgi:hypothetical protein